MSEVLKPDSDVTTEKESGSYPCGQVQSIVSDAKDGEVLERRERPAFSD